MAKCKHCGKSGLFLKLTDGLCQNCYSTMLMEKEQAELKAKAEQEMATLQGQINFLQVDLKDKEAFRQSIIDEAKAEALKEAEAEQAVLLEKIHAANLQLAEGQERLAASREEEAKLQKQVTAVTRKLQRGRELVKAVQHAQYQYEHGGHLSRVVELVDSTENFITPTVQLDPQCLDMRELRKRYRQNEKAISECFDRYKDRYTTKGNIAIYRLMCIAMAAELQNILVGLRYDKLDDALAAVVKMTDKYLQIASDGNQSIAPTVKRFVGEIDYFYQEAVRIEHEYYVKKERVKEEQRAIREQMRLDAEERGELERQKKQIEKEESKYNDQIAHLREQMEAAGAEKAALYESRIAELQAQLAGVAEQKEKIATLQNGKAGNVYVISNLGSFGEDVFKIGMTRRLDPQERIDELGSASVPFPFDVHSMVFSNDAVSLETELHHILNDKRVNKVNLRKEFFKVSLEEIEALVAEIAPTAEFKRTMLAEQYRQSLSIGHIETVAGSSDVTDDDEEDAEDAG